MADRLDFEIDVELETGLITGHAGVPGLIEAFRQTGTAAVIDREIKLKSRKRGLSASEMVESLLAMWAAGGEQQRQISMELRQEIPRRLRRRQLVTQQQIAARRDRVLLPDAVAGQVINLGPLADRIDLRLVGFPVILRQASDAFGQLWAHIGRDRVADRPFVEPAHQLMLVQRAVAAQPCIDLVDAAGQRGERLLDHPPVSRAGRHR